MSTWTAVTVTAPRELAEPIESFLFDRGAPGLQTEESAGGVRITAHFAPVAPLDALERFVVALRELFPDAAAPVVTVETITDSGWAQSWKAHFPPLAIGERVFVHPPWVDAVPAERIGIVIDPGMAFGTGHHASTRGCLMLLERALRARRHARVLDLGTGSGILAIAAVKLGAEVAWGIDTDPDACTVAAQNVAVNGVGDRVRIGSDLAAASGPFDVVLANLLAGTLVELAAELAARLRPGGVAIGAGVLVEEAPVVRDAWRAVGLVDDGELADEGWVALSARRAV